MMTFVIGILMASTTAVLVVSARRNIRDHRMRSPSSRRHVPYGRCPTTAGCAECNHVRSLQRTDELESWHARWEIDHPSLAGIASTELGDHVLTHWTDNGEPNA